MTDPDPFLENELAVGALLDEATMAVRRLALDDATEATASALSLYESRPAFAHHPASQLNNLGRVVEALVTASVADGTETRAPLSLAYRLAALQDAEIH